MGGYVTKDGHVDLARAQLILEGLSKQEGAIFARRRQNDLNQEAKNKRRQEMTDARERKRARRVSSESIIPHPSPSILSEPKLCCNGNIILQYLPI